MSVEGYVDRIEDGRLLGWAWDPQDPHAVIEVEVRVNGVSAFAGRADGFRADLEAAGKGEGRCAFSIPLTSSAVGEISALAKGDARSVVLPGGPLWAVRTPSAGDFADGAGLVGHLDALSPAGLSGWARWLDDPMRRPELELIEEGRVVVRFEADGWRRDLEEMRQGDGRWGFALPAPAALFDGAAHVLDLRVAHGGPSLLAAPIRAVFPLRTPGGQAPSPVPSRPHTPPTTGLRLRRPDAGITLSIVVNFHDMRREAERTLTSLTRGYQQGIGDLGYEVIAVDNGSREPLEAAWVEGFGPEFRLWRPAAAHASPCRALNAAAARARGGTIAVMIDGAHVLTPGALAAATAAMRREPGAMVALRHWFVGGDQRWLADAGYRRDQEDVLFARINWPRDGYALFRVGAPIGERPDSWLEGLSESNCLFMSADRWRALGGFDEAFDEPGGGFANLDLLRRAADAAPGALICLLGEATFHQYHSGTTTNVSDAEMERRVQSYARTYRRLRGRPFEGLPPEAFRIEGRIRNPGAVGLRQRPLFPAPVGVTAQARTGVARRHFDQGAEAHLQSTYAELGLSRETRWLGRPVPMAPADVLALQGVLQEARPGRIVSTCADPGLLALIDSLCGLLALDGTQIVLATAAPPVEPPPGRTRVVAGDPFDPATIRAVERELDADEEVLVLFSPPDRPGAPGEELARYAGLVSYGSYLVYLGSVFGQPWLGYSSRWHRKAIRTLTGPGADYAVDPRWTAQLITTSPSGYIRRIGRRVERPDAHPALEDLDAL